jgi:hypothetical protein
MAALCEIEDRLGPGLGENCDEGSRAPSPSSAAALYALRVSGKRAHDTREHGGSDGRERKRLGSRAK